MNPPLRADAGIEHPTSGAGRGRPTSPAGNQVAIDTRHALGAAALCAVVFCVAFVLARTESFARYDQQLKDALLGAFGHTVGQLLEVLAAAITSAFVVAVTILAAAATLALLRRWWGLAFLGVALGGAALLDVVVKALIPKPVFWYGDPRFPSGHALTTTVFFVALACIVWYAGRENMLNRLAAGALLAAGGLASLATVDFHLPTDVLGGWSLAIAWLVVLLSLFVHRLSAERSRSTRRAPAAGVACLLSLLAVVGWTRAYTGAEHAGGCDSWAIMGYRAGVQLTIVNHGTVMYPPDGLDLKYQSLCLSVIPMAHPGGALYVSARRVYRPGATRFPAIREEPPSHHNVWKLTASTRDRVRLLVDGAPASGTLPTIAIHAHTSLTLEIDPPPGGPGPANVSHG